MRFLQVSSSSLSLKVRYGILRVGEGRQIILTPKLFLAVTLSVLHSYNIGTVLV